VLTRLRRFFVKSTVAKKKRPGQSANQYHKLLKDSNHHRQRWREKEEELRQEGTNLCYTDNQSFSEPAVTKGKIEKNFRQGGRPTPVELVPWLCELHGRLTKRENLK